MTTKQIGNIGEAATINKFVQLGIPVYIPFGDNEKADIVADFNGKLNKIQIKASNKVDEDKGIVKFDLTSSTKRHTGYNKHKYTNDEIDYFICYSIPRDTIYIVPVEGQTEITIRYKMDGGRSQSNNESDFLLSKFLCDKMLA